VSVRTFVFSFYYGSGSGSGSDFLHITVPVPLVKKLRFLRLRFRFHNAGKFNKNLAHSLTHFKQVASQQGVEMMDLKHTFRHFCSTLRGGGGVGGGGGHAAQFLLTQDNFASAPDLPPIDKAAMVAAYLERHKNSDFGFQVTSLSLKLLANI